MLKKVKKTNGLVQSVREDRSYCVKGRGLAWYKKLLLALPHAKSHLLINHINNELDELESRHIKLSPHERIDVSDIYLEQSKNRLPATPYDISSRNISVKAKRDLQDSTVNDLEDNIAKQIRGRKNA